MRLEDDPSYHSKPTKGGPNVLLHGSVKLSDAEETARKRRNSAIAIGLICFMVLVFVITVAKLGLNAQAGTQDDAGLPATPAQTVEP